MTEPLPDPDQIECPRCHSPAGSVCRKPSGGISERIHRARRSAATGETPPIQTEGKPFTPETAKAASRKGVQTLALRRKEAAAAKEAAKEKAAREAIQTEAEKLARNLHAFETDRVILKRLVLDTTMSAWKTAKTAIENVRRVECDPDGRVQTVPIEKLDGHGNLRTIEVDDRRGSFEARDAAALLTAAGSALEKLRLEEGKTTSRVGVTEDPEIDRLSDRELIAILQEGLTQ